MATDIAGGPVRQPVCAKLLGSVRGPVCTVSSSTIYPKYTKMCSQTVRSIELLCDTLTKISDQ